MTMVSQKAHRVFLFLQGPHGPFFTQLGKELQRSGATVWRVGFNAGDSAFWPDKSTYIPFRARPGNWRAFLEKTVRAKSITDIVLYGDTRPVHAQARDVAQQQGLTLHVFEEGYLRPYWITYERGGSNGHSRLNDIDLKDMIAAQDERLLDSPVPPSHWGDMREHVFYGAVYHGLVMAFNQGYRNFKPHRALTVSQEFLLYLKRLTLMPVQAAERRIASLRIKLGRFPYHVALLQLEHDASFREHGPYKSQTEFVQDVVKGFAQGAPAHHHLVFKAHPLEDGRTPLRADIRRFARQFDVRTRVHFVRGGKLAGLLDEARSAVTVNSTAGQQALWRGVPLRALGSAVYAKKELVSEQELPSFFRSPSRSDIVAYRVFRDFLLSTSQLPGSFYASRGRRQALRRVSDMMLDHRDPYTLTDRETEAVKQHIRIVH